MAEREKGAFLRWLARPEAMIGLCAIVVSVIAVLISAYEARIQRDWQRAAVWPFVQLSRSYFYDPEDEERTGERRWTLTLNAENVGVGPALIKDFRVTIDGKPVTTWSEVVRLLTGIEGKVDYGQSMINGAILPAERMYRMFEYRDSPNAIKLAEAMKDRLDFEACYCSVFGECWQTSYKEFDGSRVVKSCERDETSFQE